MVIIDLTPKQAQALYLYITPRQDIDYLLLGTIVTTTEPTVPFRIDPDALEGMRYGIILRVTQMLGRDEYIMWKDILYAITNAKLQAYMDTLAA